MQKKLKKYCTLFLLLSFLANSKLLKAQEIYPAEKIDLFCDRGLYSNSETILFSGLISWDKNQELMSEVVYIELISPTGQKINQGKLKVSDNKFEGEMAIPMDVLSGHYFLRAYTKWMRNGSAYSYAYVALKILNPHTNELNSVPDSLIITQIKKSKEVNSICVINKTKYAKGEEILLTINGMSAVSKSCLSIVTQKSDPLEWDQFNKDDNYKSIYYYPETRGVSLSGRVVDIKSRSALPYQKVNIHLNAEKDFISTISDSSGYFYISFPERKGEVELLANVSGSNSLNAELVIDQDYCNKEIGLKVPPFSVDQHSEELLSIIQRAQLMKLYERKNSSEVEMVESMPFYASPFKIIDFDSYVELDSLSQYFTDLNSYVGIKKEAGKRKLYLLGAEKELTLYEPLLLLDWLPIDDDESILKLNPGRIKKFEVIPKLYIHGDILYGGVLSIITRNEDFGGYKFPESAVYLAFDFYYDSERVSEVKIRNSYEWNPSFENLIEKNEAILTAPETKGKYILVIQSADKNGLRSVFKHEFVVE